MHRRSVLKMAVAMPVIAALYGCRSVVAENSPEERARRAAKWRAEALAAFPYERVEVSGNVALQEWERLKFAGRGVPIVVGSEEDFGPILAHFHPDYWTRVKKPVLAEILAKADELAHPEGLRVYLEAQEASFKQWCKDNPQYCEPLDNFEKQLRDAGIGTDSDERPPIGQWPRQPPHPTALTGLTVAEDRRTSRPLDSVSILLIPTNDWTTIPAYLLWGNWNANPPSEYHVAALRSWRDRYGAELVGLSHDVMNIRVATKPKSRDEALTLAREHYSYCSDIVDQGVGTLSNLAAALKAYDWWYFWWD